MRSGPLIPTLLALLGLLAACVSNGAGTGTTNASPPVPPSSPSPEAGRDAAMTETPSSSPSGVRAGDPAGDPAGDHAGVNSGNRSLAKATFGAGCFWCVEAVLEQLDGVEDVSSGYMGGSVDDPTYEQVCSGQTGHAEVVQVTFDPAVIRYQVLVEWFWQLHDPTTLNRQGYDEGTQYRSAIFYHDDEQRRVAAASMAEAQPRFASPIVTEITPAATFWPAEEKHQDFYRNNRRHGYCRAVIAPKLDKLKLEK